MKAFSFRLDQVLRWRTTQAGIAKAQYSAAAAKVAAIDTEIRACHEQLRATALAIPAGDAPITGSALASWAAWTERVRLRIRDREKELQVARRELKARLEALVEANRQAKLIDQLKDNARVRWQSELDKEQENFAGEVFLGRLQSKSERARSSSG